jgi:hypothetical protein
VIIDYTVRAVAALDALAADRANEVRRGIEKLKEKPYHPVSYAMNEEGNLRQAMVREGVIVTYFVLETLILIIVLEIFDVTPYLDEDA